MPPAPVTEVCAGAVGGTESLLKRLRLPTYRRAFSVVASSGGARRPCPAAAG